MKENPLPLVHETKAKGKHQRLGKQDHSFQRNPLIHRNQPFTQHAEQRTGRLHAHQCCGSGDRMEEMMGKLWPWHSTCTHNTLNRLLTLGRAGQYMLPVPLAHMVPKANKGGGVSHTCRTKLSAPKQKFLHIPPTPMQVTMCRQAHAYVHMPMCYK